MVRTKKIRGQKRIWSRIEWWKTNASNLNLELLQSENREYTKVYVHPFFSIDVLNSVTPAPKHKTRSIIIGSLFEVYTEWKKRLDTLDKPYYLKIWFFPENVAKSQVVCAVDNMIDWYDVTFHKPEEKADKKIDLTLFGDHSEKASQLDWEYALDETLVDDDWLGDVESWETPQDYYAMQRWLKRRQKHPHRKVTRGEHVDILLPNYTVWIGGN
jgi:hypothetical protein